MNEESILEQLLKLPMGERAGFLEQACLGVPELRERVEKLLAAHEPMTAAVDGSSYLPVTTDARVNGISNLDIAPLAAAHGAQETVGAVLGRYTLETLLGEGGMGSVWVARQTEPVQRRVALKLIKSGMDSRSMLQRFEAERQALAVMDHPNIARVFDGGLLPDGRPYFAMELVNGATIQKFCDDERLSNRERLELFVKVCQAVQHAHQKGIIHRDLKPANVLVTMIDGRPEPKVIDFGVAKAIGGKLRDDMEITQFGAIIGTLEYMAPEQAGNSGMDIDTRADIYALGVILYELLTGLRPFDSKRLRKAALDEVIRILRDEEPSKPSTRLSSSDSLPSAAAERDTEPKRLVGSIRGDLDWIAMKCLDKDRNRRYESANGLVADLRRYLADEPVSAYPPSLGYRAKKFIRKYRFGVSAASLVLLALLAGIAGTTWGFLVARENARVAEINERTARDNELTAQSRLKQLEKVTDALAGVFTNLDPYSEEQEGLPLRTILARNLGDTARALEDAALDDPLAEARMESLLGQALDSVGDAESAVVTLERARTTYLEHLGPDAAATLNAGNELALAYRNSGRIVEALSLLTDILARSKATRGQDDLDTLACLNNLTSVYKRAGRLAEALPLYVETAEKTRATMGPTHRSTLAATNDLALAHLELGEIDTALPLFLETLATSRKTLGADHPTTLNVMNNLARAYTIAQSNELAFPLFIEALAGRRAKLGPQHPNTLEVMDGLGWAYVRARQADKAIPYLEEAWKGRQVRLGEAHEQTLGTLLRLAEAYDATGQIEKSLSLLAEALARTEAKLGIDHISSLNLMNNLAATYWSVRQFDKAILMFERLLPLHEKHFGPDHPYTVNVLANLGANYRDAGRLLQAVATLEEATQRLERLPPMDAARLAWVGIITTAALEQAEMYPKAEVGRRKAWQAAVSQFGTDHPNTATAATELAINLLKQSKHDAAEPLLNQAHAIRLNVAPDDWTTFNTRSLWGECLVGLKKYDEAEPLLISAFQGLEQRQEKIVASVRASRLEDAARRIVELYEAIGKPNVAEEWRSRAAGLQELNNVPTPDAAPK